MQRAAQYLSGNIVACNLAISGTGLGGASPNVNGLLATYIDPIVAYKAGSGTRRFYIFNCAIGSNDVCIGGQASVANYAALVGAMLAARKAAGYDVTCVTTILPRTDAMGNETNRAAYNALLRDSAWRATYGIDYLIDLAGETTMGNVATCANATYYSDTVHPTDAGHTLLSPIAAAVWAQIQMDHP